MKLEDLKNRINYNHITNLDVLKTIIQINNEAVKEAEKNLALATTRLAKAKLRIAELDSTIDILSL